MGYRSVVEPLPNMLEDSILCNKKGREGGREREKGLKGRRQKAVCVGGVGADSQVMSEICHQPGASDS